MNDTEGLGALVIPDRDTGASTAGAMSGNSLDAAVDYNRYAVVLERYAVLWIAITTSGPHGRDQRS